MLMMSAKRLFAALLAVGIVTAAVVVTVAAVSTSATYAGDCNSN
jgi:hypothetical protein